MRPIFVLICILFTSGLIMGQKQNNIWYFGQNAGLDFNTTPPTAIQSDLIAQEGTASISDPNGNLLFYTDGITVWDRNHNVMPNGTGLLGGISSTQAALITPIPNSSDQYYLFTTEDNSTDGGLWYSVVDMSLNGGFGDIMPATKNTLVVNQTSEKITSVLHSNGTDIWIITHLLNSNEFLSYLITSSGLNATPVISSIGSFYPADAYYGPIKASNNGSKIASASSNDEIVEMFDFNSSNGQLSNFYDLYQLFNEQRFFYGIEFSPNDSLIYLSCRHPDHSLYQVDLKANQITFNVTSQVRGYWALQRGPDNKIYIAKASPNFLDVIHQPDKSGNACQYEEKGILLAPNTFSRIGLPNFASYSFLLDSNKVFSLGNDSILCTGSSIVLDLDFPINCDTTNFLWNDGSTASQLIVNQPGVYWVEVESSCLNIRDTIEISFQQCLPIVYYDLEACTAYMSNGTNMDYSEFTPTYPNLLSCGDVTASIAFRSSPQENKHSCTPGINDSVAMCISALHSCFYTPGHQASLILEVLINPDPDSAIRLTGLEFYEKGPINYSWIDGGSGLNNYPRRYAIRILKNGNEIFSNNNIPSTRNWKLQTFDFLEDDSFLIVDSSLFRIELLPYCTVDNGGEVSVWDIDEIRIFGGCIPDQKVLPIVATKDINSSFVHKYKIHPNPATESIQIVSIDPDNLDEISVSILDLNGRLMISSKQNNIDVSSLIPGLYVCRILENNRYLQQIKLVIASN